MSSLSAVVVFVVVSIILCLVNHHLQMDRKRKKIPKVVVVNPLVLRLRPAFDVLNPSQSAILPG